MAINLLAFNADGQTVITGDPINLCRWEARTGARQLRLHTPKRYYNGGDRVVSPDGRLAASPDWRSVELWDLTESKPTTQWPYKGEDRVWRVAFAPDGKSLVTAHNRFHPGEMGAPDEGAPAARGLNGLHIWDLASGKEVRALTTARDCFYVSLALSPDGDTAITGTAAGRIGGRVGEHWATTDCTKGGPIYTWDLRSGREALTLEGHTAASHSLAVSGDGRWLASASSDKTVRVWELASGKAVFTFRDASPVLAIAVSPKAPLLAITRYAKDGPPRIRLWDLITGKEVYHFEGHSAETFRLAFSPDGSRLASALDDGTVLIWDMEPANRTAKRRPRPLLPGAWPALWEDLASPDAARAHRAVWTLVDAGEEAVARLREQLRPARADPERLRRLIADLDAPRFAAREAAARELVQLGELAEPAVLQALRGPPSLEVKKRLEPLLDYRRMHVTPANLRRLRALQVLEHIGTAEARGVLQTLARGDPEVRSTRAAAAALKRLR